MPTIPNPRLTPALTDLSPFSIGTIFKFKIGLLGGIHPHWIITDMQLETQGLVNRILSGEVDVMMRVCTVKVSCVPARIKEGAAAMYEIGDGGDSIFQVNNNDFWTMRHYDSYTTGGMIDVTYDWIPEGKRDAYEKFSTVGFA